MDQIGMGHVILAVLVPSMLIASWKDYRFGRIPNGLNAIIALAGLSAQTLLRGWPGLQDGMLGMLVGFGILILLWMVKGMGAGDVKYMAAIGAWMGPQMTIYALVVGVLIGGVLAILTILYHRNWSRAATNIGVLLTKMSSVKTAFSSFGSAESLSRNGFSMPYAIPLSLGSLSVLISSYNGWWGML